LPRSVDAIAAARKIAIITVEGEAMVELVRFPLEGGGSVYFEVEESPGMAPAGRAGTIVKEAGESFERALAEVRNAVRGAGAVPFDGAAAG
jgi:hypothetical protein